MHCLFGSLISGNFCCYMFAMYIVLKNKPGEDKTRKWYIELEGEGKGSWRWKLNKIGLDSKEGNMNQQRSRVNPKHIFHASWGTVKSS